MSRTDTAYCPTDEVVFTKLDESETVLLHLGTNYYYTLNATGSHIWEQLTEGHRPSEIVRSLCEEFEVSEARAREHVLDLLSELTSESLLEPTE